MRRPGNILVVLLVGGLLAAQPASAQTAAPSTTPAAQTTLSVEQIKDFLQHAKVIRVRSTSKGVTAPSRLTLSDGTIEHDAVFQAIDDHQLIANLGGGGRPATAEMNFVDSYKYNIAAYELATLLGLQDMMPVYVERRWDGKTGSISWFMPTLMDESDRLKKKVQPPNAVDWNNQMYRMRVFSALAHDNDRNLTNVLITPQWKIMMIDFSRAFRLQAELKNPKDLSRMDRALFAKLQALDRKDVERVTRDFLTAREIDPLMQRRDLIVAHFKQLIADLGESKVLY